MFLRRRISLGLVLLLISLVGCKKSQLDDCVTSKGPEQSRTFNLSPFNKLIINDQFDVYLIQDSTYRIDITAGRNMFDGFGYAVKDSTLELSDNNTCNWVRDYGHKYKVTIHCKDLKHIILNDNATLSNKDSLFINSLGMEQRSMADSKLNICCRIGLVTVTLYTAGNLTLTGYSQIFVGYMYDVSSLDARGLKSPYCFGFNSSPSDMYLNSSYQFGYNIYYSGNIFYTGNPFVVGKGEVSGSGKLIKL